MKLFGTFISLVAGIALIGCASTRERTHADAPDGFYVEATHGAESYAMQVVPPRGGRAFSFRIQPYTNFFPQRVFVFDAPEGYYVQIDGRATVDGWSNESIIFVADHKPYFELGKSGQAVSEDGQRVGPSAMISLVLHTREEAEAVAASIRRQYSLPL